MHPERVLGILLVIPIIIFEACGQTALKKYHLTKNKWFFLLGVLGYACVAVFLVLSYQYMRMGITNAIWSAGSVVAILLVGMYFFDEKLPLHDVFGIILITIGIFIILAYDDHGKK